MPNARVIPNRHRTLRPMHAGNTIMIVGHQTHDIVADHLVFIVIYAIYTRYVEPDASEDTFPAGLAVSSYHWVNGSKGVADVQW